MSPLRLPISPPGNVRKRLILHTSLQYLVRLTCGRIRTMPLGDVTVTRVASLSLFDRNVLHGSSAIDTKSVLRFLRFASPLLPDLNLMFQTRSGWIWCTSHARSANACGCPGCCGRPALLGTMKTSRRASSKYFRLSKIMKIARERYFRRSKADVSGTPEKGQA
jgi:hypothetical protein